jgi:hypothetical protein
MHSLAEKSTNDDDYPISKVFVGGTLSSEKYRVNQKVGEILVFNHWKEEARRSILAF